MRHEELTHEVIGAAIEVHKQLGPGLLESTYEACLCRELHLRDVPFQRQIELPVEYKDLMLECGYRIDIVVDNKVLLELKAVESTAPVHEAQLLTYMKLSGLSLGLLINFNVPVLKDGILRRVL
jgi:GxxExxY protein